MMSLYITHRLHEFIILLPLTTHLHTIVHLGKYHITVVMFSLILGLRLGLGLVVVGHELT